MDASLIICSRDRCHQLARCLQFVERIKFAQPWELIIIDNGSVDETASVIRDFVTTTTVPVVIHLLEPAHGKSNGLNMGLTVARGKIIAFTDDDCYVAEDFLSAACLAFKDDPLLGYITGRVMLHDPMDYPETINESLIPVAFPARSCHHLWEVKGANMTFRREALVDIGGFDPLLGPGSVCHAAEDIDMACRANALGWRGEYRPELIVRHHHGRKVSDSEKLRHLYRGYATGKGAFHVKLFLRGHEFRWCCWIFFHYYMANAWRWRRGFFWEAIGGITYASAYLKLRCRRWFERHGRKRGAPASPISGSDTGGNEHSHAFLARLPSRAETTKREQGC
jgi:glycosyltransferase involved in cell wall biosynthesis